MFQISLSHLQQELILPYKGKLNMLINLILQNGENIQGHFLNIKQRIRQSCMIVVLEYKENSLMKIRKQDKNKANIIKKMKSNVKQDYFSITSPEDELKQISLSNTVQKASYQTQRLAKGSTERFAIDSWDISQKLKPFKNQSSRHKQNLSVNLSLKHNKIRYRAKSAFLQKDLQSTNSHNFSSRKKCSFELSTERKASVFFSKPLSLIDKAKISLFLSKESIKNKQIAKRSRNKPERQLREEQQTRTKTIQNYLIRQKQMISREKQMLMSQRIGMEGILVSMYPTQYWESMKTQSPIRKSRKLKLEQTPLTNSNSKQRKSPINSSSPLQKNSFSSKIEDSQQSRSNQSKSPIKRFIQFKEKLHQIVIL